MGAAMKIDDPVDISFMLLMKYRKPVIKLEELLPDTCLILQLSRQISAQINALFHFQHSNLMDVTHLFMFI